MVGEGVVLLVHDALVLSEFAADAANQKQEHIVDPLCSEGIAMKELVLASKCHALELEPVEGIKWNEDGHSPEREGLSAKGKDL